MSKDNAQDAHEYHDDKDQADALRKGNGIHCGELFLMMFLVVFLMAAGVQLLVMM